jgi:hypothetical protein
MSPASDPDSDCRPRESGDPYPAASRCGTACETSKARCLWVPAFTLRYAHICENARECRLRLGRAVPQRSLPPCGGGTGRGVLQALHPFANKHKVQRSGFWVRAHEYVGARCFHRHPPPCPSPAWGKGTVRRGPSHVTRSACGELPKMCACASASAGATALVVLPREAATA